MADLKIQSPIIATCCQAKNIASFYCIHPSCQLYICEACSKTHFEQLHSCVKLADLPASIKGLGESQLPMISEMIGEYNRHIKVLREGEDEVAKNVNDMKTTVVSMLWEIYRLVNDCLAEEIQSNIFYMNQLCEKRREIETKLSKIQDQQKIIQTICENTNPMPNTSDNIEIYKQILNMKQKEEEANDAVKDTLNSSKKNSKYRYDALNNKLMGLIATFIENLKKRKGGLEDLEEKYKRPDYKKVVKFKDVRTEFKEKIIPHISPYTYYLKENSNELNIYNMRTEKGTRLRPENIKFLKFSDTVQIGTKIYTAGGGVFEKTVFEYDYILYGNNVERKSDMNVGKNLHKLLPINKYTILSIGGQCPDGPMDFCEMFDIPENLWKLLPNINEKKYGVAPCCFEQRHVYIFGGFTIDEGIEKFLSTIEYLDYKSEVQKWEIIKVNGINTLKPRIDMAAIQINKTQILVFGGYNGEFREFSNIFTPGDKSIIETEAMTKGEAFNARKPVIHNDKVYIIGYKQKDIHIFDTKVSKWSIVTSENWLNRLAMLDEIHASLQN